MPFDELHLVDATFGEVEVRGDRLVVAAKNVVLTDGDAASMSRYQPLASCQLIFDGVVESRRTVLPYRSANKRSFFAPQQIVDVEPRSAGAEAHEYTLEGELESPSAWIEEWTIRAASFWIETP